MQCGVKQGPANIDLDILVDCSFMTAGPGLGTDYRSGSADGLGVVEGQAAVSRHVLLEEDDHPTDGGAKVPRRGDSY